MTECAQVSFDFPPVKRRRIEAGFSGGDITSDGGLLLLRQAGRRLGFLEAVNARFPDPRDGRYVRHDQLILLRQRVYALCQDGGRHSSSAGGAVHCLLCRTALYRHQSQRRCPAALRPSLLCPWQDGEPHQGAATGSVRRSHQRPSVVG